MRVAAESHSVTLKYTEETVNSSAGVWVLELGKARFMVAVGRWELDG